MTRTHYMERGNALLEIVVVIGIFVVISAAVWALMANVFTQGTMLRTSLAANDEARIAVKRFTQEVRVMSPSSLGAYPIALASSTSFTFYSDLDHDSLKERYRYFIEGGSLKKGVTKPTGSPLVYNSANEKVTIVVSRLYGVSPTVFNYFDSNNSQMSDPINVTNVRSVEIVLPAALDPRQGLNSVVFSSRATMRTLKDNY
jgi:hypothetical protein